MPQVGLLPLTLTARPTDPGRLLAASHLVQRRLYVSLEGDWDATSIELAEERIRSVYSLVGRWRSKLDVRVLLPAADGSDTSPASHLADLDALFFPSSATSARSYGSPSTTSSSATPSETCATSSRRSPTRR